MKHTIYDLYKELGLNEITEIAVHACGCIGREFKHVKQLRCYAYEQEQIDEAIYYRFRMKSVDDFEYFEITEDNEMILYYAKKQLCTKCYKESCEKIHCKDMPRPVGFENVTKYHGIVALSRTNLNDGIRHLEKVVNNPTYETCCATEPIGALGVILDGEVITASNIDLYSHVDENGRYFEVEENGDAYNGIIHYAEDLVIETDDNTMNNELVTINNKIVKIWVSKYADNREKQAAKYLAKKYDVDLVVVDNAASMPGYNDDEQWYF